MGENTDSPPVIGSHAGYIPTALLRLVLTLGTIWRKGVPVQHFLQGGVMVCRFSWRERSSRLPPRRALRPLERCAAFLVVLAAHLEEGDKVGEGLGAEDEHDGGHHPCARERVLEVGRRLLHVLLQLPRRLLALDLQASRAGARLGGARQPQTACKRASAHIHAAARYDPLLNPGARSPLAPHCRYERLEPRVQM
eukprot:1187336-Prorocentrum_minimum.AAC.10